MKDLPTSTASAPSAYQRAMVQRLIETIEAHEGSFGDSGSLVDAAGISRHEAAIAFSGEGSLVLALAEHYAAFLAAPLHVCEGPTEVREVLRDFGSRYVAAERLGALSTVYRLGLSESGRSSEFGASFLQAGPAALSRSLSEFFLSAQHAGLPCSENECDMAGHLLALLRGGWHVARMLGCAEPAEPDDEAGEVERIVELFCEGMYMGRHHAYAVA